VSFVIVLLAMFLFMYLLLIRPQQQQRRRHKALIEGLQPGAEVITAGGIYGDVVEVEPDRVVLEIAEDVHIEVAKQAIATVVPQEEVDAEAELEEAQAALESEVETVPDDGSRR
jgi:preprotein translocase subunit YajC